MVTKLACTNSSTNVSIRNVRYESHYLEGSHGGVAKTYRGKKLHLPTSSQPVELPTYQKRDGCLVCQIIWLMTVCATRQRSNAYKHLSHEMSLSKNT